MRRSGVSTVGGVLKCTTKTVRSEGQADRDAKRSSNTKPALRDRFYISKLGFVKLCRLLLCLLCNLLRCTLGGLCLLAEHAALGGFCSRLLLELLDATSRVDKLLLPGVERMAIGTKFDVDVFHGRTSCNHIAARTNDLGVRVIGRMNIRLHSVGTIAKAGRIGKPPSHTLGDRLE